MPKISQKNIFLIFGVAVFLVIATLLAFYFISQNSANNSKSQAQNSNNSQSSNSQNSLSNSSLSVSNSDSIFNANSSQISAFSNNFTSLVSQFSNNSQNNSSSNSKANCTTQNKIFTDNYTNPNYPNFRLNFDSSWKIKTESKPSLAYPDLCEDSIILFKNNSRLKFELESVIVMNMFTERKYWAKEISLGKITRKYVTDSNGKFFEDNSKVLIVT